MIVMHMHRFQPVNRDSLRSGGAAGVALRCRRHDGHADRRPVCAGCCRLRGLGSDGKSLPPPVSGTLVEGSYLNSSGLPRGCSRMQLTAFSWLRSGCVQLSSGTTPSTAGKVCMQADTPPRAPCQLFRVPDVAIPQKGGDRNMVSPRAQCTAPHAPSTPAPPSCSANPLLTPSRSLCRLGFLLRCAPHRSWRCCSARRLAPWHRRRSKSNASDMLFPGGQLPPRVPKASCRCS